MVLGQTIPGTDPVGLALLMVCHWGGILCGTATIVFAFCKPHRGLFCAALATTCVFYGAMVVSLLLSHRGSVVRLYVHTFRMDIATIMFVHLPAMLCMTGLCVFLARKAKRRKSSDTKSVDT